MAPSNAIYFKEGGPDSPCTKDCKNRNAECHGTCEAYLKYYEERQKFIQDRYLEKYNYPPFDHKKAKVGQF